jgi:hypothetical protein
MPPLHATACKGGSKNSNAGCDHSFILRRRVGDNRQGMETTIVNLHPRQVSIAPTSYSGDRDATLPRTRLLPQCSEILFCSRYAAYPTLPIFTSILSHKHSLSSAFPLLPFLSLLFQLVDFVFDWLAATEPRSSNRGSGVSSASMDLITHRTPPGFLPLLAESASRLRPLSSGGDTCRPKKIRKGACLESRY